VNKCKYCQKRLSYNNKLGFCLNCLPEERIISVFNSGKTIQHISESIFNSCSGRYRSLIRGVLKRNIKDFEKLKKENRNKVMSQSKLELPLKFILKLYKDGKTVPEIHKAVASKGYNAHVATIRKRLKDNGCDIKKNAAWKNIKRQRTSKKRKRLIKHLWEDGNSIKSISKALSMAELTVKTYLHQMGFKTKLPQNYILKNYSEDEKRARKYLENQGYVVKKCYFLCQRKNDIIIPKELRELCEKCPVKRMNFKHKEFYDFILEKEGKFSIAEVKKVYVSKNWERAHFSLGQFINLPEILKNNVPFHLIIIRGDNFEETIF